LQIGGFAIVSEIRAVAVAGGDQPKEAEKRKAMGTKEQRKM
jgi:hypothetical protein